MDNLVANIIDAGMRLAGGADPGKRKRALEALDHAVKRWAKKSPWPALKRHEEFVHAGGRSMSFPERVWSIQSIIDKSTGQKVDPLEGWDSQHPEVYSAGTAGSPAGYRKQGVFPVACQPATDCRLTLENSGSEAYSVRIFGLARDTTASGTPHELYEVREVFTMGSTTPTVTANTFASVEALEKDSNTQHSLVVKDSTGAIIARIPTWQARAEYPVVEFLPAPGAGTVFLVDYLTAPDDVTTEETTVESGIAREYLEWYVAGQVLWASGKRDDAQVAWAKAEEVLTEEATKNTTLGEGDFRAFPQDTYLGREDFYG